MKFDDIDLLQDVAERGGIGPLLGRLGKEVTAHPAFLDGMLQRHISIYLPPDSVPLPMQGKQPLFFDVVLSFQTNDLRGVGVVLRESENACGGVAPHFAEFKTAVSAVGLHRRVSTKSAPGRSRACGLLIRNQPLCLLSYGGVEPQKWYRALDLNQDLLSSELSASSGLG